MRNCGISVILYLNEMIKPLLLLCIFFCLCSCGIKSDNQTSASFNEFVFSLSAMYENYSVKFTRSDTIFLEERFPEPTKRYFALLNDTVRKRLNFILDTLNLKGFDTSYIQENLEDGAFIKFHLRSDTIEKTISIYGKDAPPSFYTVAQCLDSLTKALTKHPTARQVDFGDLSGVNPPPAPLPPKLND